MTWNRTGLLLPILLLLLLSGCATTPSGEDKAKRLKQAAKANVQLGIAYMRDGEMEMSLKKFQKALDQDPELASAHFFLALAQKTFGEYEEALRDFEEAHRVSADSSEALGRIGDCHHQLGRVRGVP